MAAVAVLVDFGAADPHQEPFGAGLEIDKAGAAGTNTGVISRALKYDQPNVYLTLNNMKDSGFVEKDESTDPHTYRLGSALRRW